MNALHFSIAANGIPRLNRVVRVGLGAYAKQALNFALEELDTEGRVISSVVPFQVDIEGDDATLSLLLTGKTGTDEIRHFRLCLDVPPNRLQPQAPLVTLNDATYHGQAAYHIRTPNGTYIYHVEAGAFAALYDETGKDWIGFRPFGGSDGMYRGIPNIKHPDDYLHPGFKNARSRILSQGAICCRIHTETLDGVCEAIWEIYPHYISFHILKAPDVYWLLYEGTPHGTLDETHGYIMRDDGTQTPLSETWSAPLESGWLYFGHQQHPNALLFAQHTVEAKMSSYFPMEGNMTVFGFGRQDLEHYLQRTPATYTIGLVNPVGYDDVAQFVESVRQDVVIRWDAQ